LLRDLLIWLASKEEADYNLETLEEAIKTSQITKEYLTKESFSSLIHPDTGRILLETVAEEIRKELLSLTELKLDVREMRECLTGLVEAGICCKENKEAIITLMTTIAEEAEKSVGPDKNRSIKFVEMGPFDPDSRSVYNVTAIEAARDMRDFAYGVLGGLAKAVKKDGLEPAVIDLNLLTTIAKNMGGYTRDAYRELSNLAEAVKSKSLDPNGFRSQPPDHHS